MIKSIEAINCDGCYTKLGATTIFRVSFTDGSKPQVLCYDCLKDMTMPNRAGELIMGAGPSEERTKMNTLEQELNWMLQRVLCWDRKRGAGYLNEVRSDAIMIALRQNLRPIGMRWPICSVCGLPMIFVSRELFDATMRCENKDHGTVTFEVLTLLI